MGAEAIDFYEDSLRYAHVYLLDTSTLLWSIMDPDRLSETARNIWQNPNRLIAVSVVSYWEIAIKANSKVFQVENVGKWWAHRVLPFAVRNGAYPGRTRERTDLVTGDSQGPFRPDSSEEIVG